jgi:hypothetical protein
MNADNANHAARGRSRSGFATRKYLKYFWMAAASVVFVYIALVRLWVMSGSGEWELEIDRDGVQVYSMKVPGDSVVLFKGVSDYHGFTYSQMLAAFNDETFLEDCGKLSPGCLEYRFLKPWNPDLMRNTQYWRTELFFPFANREVVVNGSIRQDERTGDVLLENVAAPSLIPPNECCVRITRLHNTFRHIPLENGGIRLEYTQNFDAGGFFPDFLTTFGAEGVHSFLRTDLPALWKTYENVELDFIVPHDARAEWTDAQARP